MKITFLEDTRYSEDGHTIKRGMKGETKDVAHSTACSLLNSCKAVECEGSLTDEFFECFNSPDPTEQMLRMIALQNRCAAKAMGLI